MTTFLKLSNMLLKTSKKIGDDKVKFCINDYRIESILKSWIPCLPG
jgi:hypothetical protein